MHAVFIPYGMRSHVERFLRDMEAQKMKLPIWKGKEKTYIWIDGQVRQLPFGFYEYVFPKENRDLILTTLDFDKKCPYKLDGLKMKLFRKITSCKKVKKFDNSNKFLWIKDFVSIIPVGEREDGEFTDPKGDYKGWTHEGL